MNPDVVSTACHPPAEATVEICRRQAKMTYSVSAAQRMLMSLSRTMTSLLMSLQAVMTPKRRTLGANYKTWWIKIYIKQLIYLYVVHNVWSVLISHAWQTLINSINNTHLYKKTRQHMFLCDFVSLSVSLCMLLKFILLYCIYVFYWSYCDRTKRVKFHMHITHKIHQCLMRAKRMRVK